MQHAYCNMLGTPARYILHTAYCIGLAVTAHCLVALLGLVRLWLGFGFGFCLLCFSLLTLAFPSDSASVFLCFCLYFPLFLRALLLVSACVSHRFSACFCVCVAAFLLVSACVSPCSCLCFPRFMLVLLSVSACVSLCFC